MDVASVLADVADRARRPTRDEVPPEMLEWSFGLFPDTRRTEARDFRPRKRSGGHPSPGNTQADETKAEQTPRHAVPSASGR